MVTQQGDVGDHVSDGGNELRLIFKGLVDLVDRCCPRSRKNGKNGGGRCPAVDLEILLNSNGGNILMVVNFIHSYHFEIIVKLKFSCLLIADICVFVDRCQCQLVWANDRIGLWFSICRQTFDRETDEKNDRL